MERKSASSGKIDFPLIIQIILYFSSFYTDLFICMTSKLIIEIEGDDS